MTIDFTIKTAVEILIAILLIIGLLNEEKLAYAERRIFRKAKRFIKALIMLTIYKFAGRKVKQTYRTNAGIKKSSGAEYKAG